MKSAIKLSNILICIFLFSFTASAQQTKEILLSETENAYNPIPSPDGSMIAYIRTGWGRNLPFLSQGRSNLISEVKVMDANGRVLTEKPLADSFLAGWTPDNKNLVCFRDWRYFLVSLDGKKSKEVYIQIEPSGLKERPAEWGSYLPGIDAMIFAHHNYSNEKYGISVIRTVDKEIAQKKFPFLDDNFASFGEMLVPSPDGRYIVAIDDSFKNNHLWVYDTQDKSWSDLGKIIIHPKITFAGMGNNDWEWMRATWNPWFADSSHLALISGSFLLVVTPDGKTKQIICKVPEQVGLPTPSPDGKMIAYVTFNAKLHPTQPHWTFWGNTTIQIVSTIENSVPRAVTKTAIQTTYSLGWLNPSEIVFDRLENEHPSVAKHRLWKVSIN